MSAAHASLHLVRRWIGGAWGWLRALTGDDAYERYRHHHAARHPDTPLMGRRAFYEETQRRKWSGVSRCC